MRQRRVREAAGTMTVSVGQVAFAVLFSLALACTATTRPMATGAPSQSVPSDAGGVDDDGDDGDGDGPVEATNEIADGGAASPCPTNMALVTSGDARFCIDRYEASLVETDRDGVEKPFPHWLPVDGHAIRAVSEPN